MINGDEYLLTYKIKIVSKDYENNIIMLKYIKNKRYPPNPGLWERSVGPGVV